jgi:hypothetical protein
VAALAVRLYLGGTGAPRRYLAWGQAVRRAVLAVFLLRTVLVLGGFLFVAWTHHLLGWLPAPPGPVASVVTSPLVRGPLPAPQNLGPAGSGGAIQAAPWYALGYAYIVVYLALVLGRYRTAKLSAVLAAGPDLVYLLQLWLADHQPQQIGPWVGWILFSLVPVLALVLLAVLFGIMRIVFLAGQLHDFFLRTGGVVQLAVLAVAVALVARDGARAQGAVSPPPPQVSYRA